MRLFLAIDLPSEVKQTIFSQLTSLREQYPDCNWVKWEDYHITVHFFGEVSQLDRLKERLERNLYEARSFRLYSQGIDLFMKNKITFFITFLRQKIIEDIEQGLKRDFGENEGDERTFVPHLTVGRYRIPSKQQYFVLQKRLARSEIDIEFPVKKFVLFESDLSGKSPSYQKRMTFKLLNEST